MNESAMQAVLMRYAMEEKRHQLTIPNLTTLYGWEADMISVTKSWLTHEYEIKLSRSDFKADAKKEWKHQDLLSRFNGVGKREPRSEMQRKLLEMSVIDLSIRAPNYFWYATYGFDIEPSDLPPYAGWLRVWWWDSGHFYRIKVEKNAPRLHTNKMEEEKRMDINRWLSYKLKNMYRLTYLNHEVA